MTFRDDRDYEPPTDEDLEMIEELEKNPATAKTTASRLIAWATDEYLSGIDRDDPPPPEVIEGEIIALAQKRILGINAALELKASDARALELPKELTPACLARVILATTRMGRIPLPGARTLRESSFRQKGHGGFPLCSYVDDPEDPAYGTYAENETAIVRRLYALRDDVSSRVINETLMRLEALAPIVEECDDPDLVPVANGIFDRRDRDHPENWQLLPFSPDLVFRWKLATRYVENAPDVEIPDDYAHDGSVWRPSDVIPGLVEDDPEIETALNQMLSFACRARVRTNKTVWLVGGGNNGKGMLMALLENMLGKANVTHLTITDYGKSAELEMLPDGMCNAGDDNESSGFLDTVAPYKSRLTGDTVNVNPKYKKPFSFRPIGLDIQGVNGFPKVKDQTAAFLRRLLLIPMTKIFVEGKSEKKYIKQDYLGRPEVLEWFLYQALTNPADEFILPEASQALLDRFKSENNNVHAFWTECVENCGADLLPARMLYSAYRAWYEHSQSGTGWLGYQKFRAAVGDLVASDKAAEWVDRTGQNAAKISTEVGFRGAVCDFPQFIVSRLEEDGWVSKVGVQRQFTYPNGAKCPVDRGYVRRDFLEFGVNRAEMLQAYGDKEITEPTADAYARHLGVGPYAKDAAA